MKHIDIVFDGPPSHESGRFVEVEDDSSAGIKFGEWVEREDDLWALRITPEAMLEALSEREVYVAWTQTDLIEGRGSRFPLAVCEAESTAIRLGRKGYVQGGDCPISKVKALRIGYEYLLPGRIIGPTREDEIREEQLERSREAIVKAKDAGLSEQDIAAIRDQTGQ